MQQRIGHLVIEVFGAESPKFTAPLLLLHGLWCDAAVWRRWAGFLAHRGWSCYAPSLRGQARAAAAHRWEAYQQGVASVLAALDAPPVIIGHDMGALLALRAAHHAAAVVALAPYLPASLRGGAEAELIELPVLPVRIWRRSVAPPRGDRGRMILADPQLPRREEPLALVQALLQDDRGIEPTNTPTLFVVGGRDPFVARIAVERLAHQLGAATIIAEDAGHALPVEPGWEQRVSNVHRWLIQTLGDPLLALREESETE